MSCEYRYRVKYSKSCDFFENAKKFYKTWIANKK